MSLVGNLLSGRRTKAETGIGAVMMTTNPPLSMFARTPQAMMRDAQAVGVSDITIRAAERVISNRLSTTDWHLEDAEDIEVGEGEVNAQVAQMARSRGVRPDQMRAELQQSGRLNELALSIREAKVLDRVLSKAKVSDIKAEEWNALVAERQKAAAKAAGRAG